MLLDILQDGFTREGLISFLLFLPVMLISLPFHEAAHAWAANKMGDPTARNFGRLTLNPVRHLDLAGTLCMLLLGVGWAKPVPVNSRNFRKPRQGMALTALAGPVSNLFLCFLCSLLYRLAWVFLLPLVTEAWVEVFLALFNFLYLMSFYNAALCVFNLIPIPPLDGARIVSLILPPKWYYAVMKYERYLMYGFLILVFVCSNVFRISLVSVPASWICDSFQSLFSLIPWLS